MDRKPLFWVRSSKRDLKAMPDVAQDMAGGALDDVQWGLTPDEAKPLKGFGGTSVQEIVCDYDGNAYRAVYTVEFSRAVYVLHCFQKKSKTGAKTPKLELSLIKSWLVDARKDYEKWSKENPEKES